MIRDLRWSATFDHSLRWRFNFSETLSIAVRDRRDGTGKAHVIGDAFPTPSENPDARGNAVCVRFCSFNKKRKPEEWVKADRMALAGSSFFPGRPEWRRRRRAAVGSKARRNDETVSIEFSSCSVGPFQKQRVFIDIWMKRLRVPAKDGVPR